MTDDISPRWDDEGRPWCDTDACDGVDTHERDLNWACGCAASADEHVPCPVAVARMATELKRLEQELCMALEQVERWKDASGLIDSSGDPDGVSPNGMRKYWEGVEAQLAKANATIKQLRIDSIHARTVGGRGE